MDIDFERLWREFWEGLGMPKTSIFPGFSKQNRRQKKNDVLEGPRKLPRRGKKLPPEALSRSERPGPGLLSGSWVAGGGVGEVQPKRTRSLSNTPLGQRPGEFFTLCACHRPRDRESFRGNFSMKNRFRSSFERRGAFGESRGTRLVLLQSVCAIFR